MASKVSSRQQAMTKARERRTALDQDRAARDRRVEEATAQVLLQLQERAAAEQAVQVANAQIGVVLRRLLDDEGIAAHGVGGLVELTVSEVRRLARAVPPPLARARSTLPGLRRASRGPAVTWRRCPPGGRDAGARRPQDGHGLTLPRCAGRPVGSGSAGLDGRGACGGLDVMQLGLGDGPRVRGARSGSRPGRPRCQTSRWGQWPPRHPTTTCMVAPTPSTEAART